MDDVYNSTEHWLPVPVDDLSTTEPPYHVPRQAYYVMSGVVIIAGLIFNTLSLVVLTSSATFRQTPSGLYLLCLSVADTVFLFGEFLRWLNAGRKSFDIGIHFIDTDQFACKLIYFLRYGGKMTSAWLTVAITSERLLLVACPLKHAQISTLHGSRILIAAMFVVCFLLASFPWWSVGIRLANMEIFCGIEDELWYEVGSWVSLRIGSLLLPGLIVCVMTTLIIYYLTRARRTRDRKLSARRTIQRQDTIEMGKMSVEKQLTIMLVAVAIAFLVLRLPYTITFYLNKYKYSIWPEEDKWFYYSIFAANKIADTFATTNYAINFFLYYLCGNAFRKQLKLVCACVPCRPSRRLERQRSVSSSLRLTTVYSRSVSANSRQDSPKVQPINDNSNAFI